MAAKQKIVISLIAAVLIFNIYTPKADAWVGGAVRIVAGSQAEKVLLGGMAEKMGVKYASQAAMDKARERWNMHLYEEFVKKQAGQANKYDEFANIIEVANTAEIIPFPGTEKPGFGKVVISSAAFILGADIAWEVYQEIQQAQQNKKYLDGYIDSLKAGTLIKEIPGVLTVKLFPEAFEGAGEQWIKYYDSDWGANADYPGDPVWLGITRVPVENTSYSHYFKRVPTMDSTRWDGKILRHVSVVVNTVNGTESTSTKVLDEDLNGSHAIGNQIPGTTHLPDLNDFPEVLSPITTPGITNPGIEEFPEGFPTEFPITIPISDPYPYPGSLPEPINEPVAEPVAEPNPEPNPEPEPDPGTEPGTEPLPETDPKWYDTPTGDPTGVDWGKLKRAAGGFTTSFPFSLPWDIGRAFDSVFGNVDEGQVPEWNLHIKAFGTTHYFTLKLPQIFVDWSPVTKAFILIIFDISLIYSVRKLLGGAS